MMLDRHAHRCTYDSDGRCETCGQLADANGEVILFTGGHAPTIVALRPERAR